MLRDAEKYRWRDKVRKESDRIRARHLIAHPFYYIAFVISHSRYPVHEIFIRSFRKTRGRRTNCRIGDITVITGPVERKKIIGRTVLELLSSRAITSPTVLLLSKGRCVGRADMEWTLPRRLLCICALTSK